MPSPLQKILVITVCPREPGVVTLALERGDRPRRLDAPAVAAGLEALIRARGLTGRVLVQRACAGGCSLPGPNVSVTLFPQPRAGERPDHVAVGWRSYVGTLDTLDCLAAIVDDNVRDDASTEGIRPDAARAGGRRGARSRRR
jgi:hypothetical protein